MQTPKTYYSIPRAAELCGVSRTTVWNWVKSGYIEALVTPGGHHRILKEEIERILNMHGKSVGQTQQKPKTILIVDDDLQLIKILRIRLTRAGYHIETARDGFDAGLKVHQIKPHLVLLDLFMPGLDGFEVCRAIKRNEELNQIKVLAFTGQDTHEIRSRILALGADAYLPKSVDYKVLLERIETLMSPPLVDGGRRANREPE